jgi:glycosyltransferase involved in cell wall biosynthesis
MKKIVAFSTYCTKGGAGKAALKFCQNLNDLGFDVELYTTELNFKKFDCTVNHNYVKKNKVTWKIIDSIIIRTLSITKRGLFSSAFIGSISNKDIDKIIQSADIVFIFWINDGFLSLSNIKHIINSNKKVFWRLSDEWPISNGFHYAENINTDSINYVSRKLLFQLERYKILLCSSNNLTFIAPSKWIYNITINKSKFFEKTKYIPTTVDLDIFNPNKREMGRNIFSFINSVKYVLFGSISSDRDPRKGFDLLINSLNHLPKIINNKHLIKIVVFGNQDANKLDNIPYEVIYIGNIDKNNDLANLYAACDVFVAPAREENLANTCLEACSSGLPLVAFDIGGMPDVIKHSKNGYLTTPFNCEEFACNIASALNNRDKLGRYSRLLAFNNFSIDIFNKEIKKIGELNDSY